jgi:RNA recognition motif-containing protein
MTERALCEKAAGLSLESGGASESMNSAAAGCNCNLIVNYLPQDMDEIGLAALFADDGKITSTKVIRDKSTRKSLGYGFVSFANERDAQKSIQSKNGFSIGYKRLKVALARPSSDKIKNCKIYVTNLPKSYNEKAIRNYFSMVKFRFELYFFTHLLTISIT